MTDLQPKPLLRLINVSRTFQMGQVSVDVVKDLSLDIYEGELLVVLGPSGSGKTTILNLVGGLDSPSNGQIFYRDTDLTTASAKQLTAYRRDEVGFVFQFYNLVPNLTARENVVVATDIAQDPMDVDEVIERVDMDTHQHQFPAQMSGGEQQRISIARAIAKNPTLLLCDEPTGALDFATGKKVMRLLVDLNRDLGKTIVIITHNSALAQIAHRVVHLRSGEISELTENETRIAPEEVVW